MRPDRSRSGGLAASLIVSLLAACAAPDPADRTAHEPGPSLSLAVFDCGRIKLEDVSDFGLGNDDTDVRELAVPCYVIRHPDGVLLWDGGMPSTLAQTPGWQGEGMQTRLDRTLAAQLESIGMTMADFDYVAFSHLHFDHVGVANEIEGATWLTPRPELEAGFAEEVTTPGFQPEVYQGLAELERIVLDGDHDVFGDGRVRLIFAPGHTPGHQVLFLDLEETGPLVLSGDLYHFRQSREERRVPSFNTDADATRASMERVEALVAESNATFWIQHELALFETLDKAPALYR